MLLKKNYETLDMWQKGGVSSGGKRFNEEKTCVQGGGGQQA